MELKAYLLSRALQSIATFFAALTIVFFLFRIVPGDPVALLIRLGAQSLTAEEIEGLRITFGLDRPLYQQYFIYLWNIIRFDFGTSFFYRIPVTELFFNRLVNTLILVGTGTFLSILLGLALGVVAGWFRGKKQDRAAIIFSLLFYSMPSFWIGMVLIYILAINIPIFPTGGMLSARLADADDLTRLADFLRHLMLPLLTYSLGFAGQYALIMRNTLTGVMTEDYILTAKAKGLTDLQILKSHALKNAALPTISIVAINIGWVVLGTISIETVFNWPGVGRLVFESIFYRDFPILQGTFVFFAIFMILANFVADILYAVLDPRVRY